jgi:hypothetical protein
MKTHITILGAYGNWVGTIGFSFLLTAFLWFHYVRERERERERKRESPPQLYVHLFTHSPTPYISTILSRKGLSFSGCKSSLIEWKLRNLGGWWWWWWWWWEFSRYKTTHHDAVKQLHSNTIFLYMAIKAWKSSFHWQKVGSISTQNCAWAVATHPCMFFGLVISFQSDPSFFNF